MQATSFDESNAALGPPVGMTEDEVYSLSVWRGKDAQGTPMVVSCWKVTKEELEEWQRTGRVWLTVIGETMPPVALTVQSPFVEQKHGTD